MVVFAEIQSALIVGARAEERQNSENERDSERIDGEFGDRVLKALNNTKEQKKMRVVFLVLVASTILNAEISGTVKIIFV